LGSPSRPSTTAFLERVQSHFLSVQRDGAGKSSSIAGMWTALLIQCLMRMQTHWIAYSVWARKHPQKTETCNMATNRNLTADELSRIGEAERGSGENRQVRYRATRISSENPSPSRQACQKKRLETKDQPHSQRRITAFANLSKIGQLERDFTKCQSRK